ncbi:MAG: peptidyl-prolyl cis-trans isomerase SurA [Saprospiraceae bacterium]|jgi:peptidyl-prolyl cis-trans isomerase SurA
MKYFLGIVLALGFCLNIQAQGEEIVLDKVVATVGDQIILLSQVEERYRGLEFKPENARCLILDQMLVEKVLLVQAELDSVLVDDSEVDVQLDARIDRILGMMNYDRSQFISYYNKTPEEVKEGFREDLRNQLVTQRMQSTVMQGMKVTPIEVKAFYAQIPRDSLPYFNSEVEIGEIVLAPKPNYTGLASAKNELENIRKRIIGGKEDFANLAKQYSMDPGSGRDGGDLGWAKRGSYVTEFEAAAYKLEKDEISPVTRTKYGYHIIQLLERRGNLIHLRHILIKPRVTMEDKILVASKLDSIRSMIILDSIPFSYAVARHSSDDAQSKTNAGLMINPTTGTSIFEVADLEPDIYFTIDTMEVGDIAAPMFYRNAQNGEELCRIVMLRSQTEPHQANLKDDYSKIQAAATSQKQATYLSDWVDARVAEMYIQVDAVYDCEVMKKWRSNSRMKP